MSAPFHRVASRWATSVVCGALGATLVVALFFFGEALWNTGRLLRGDTLTITGLLGLCALAFLAPLEGAAALGRRVGVRFTAYLLVVVPPAAILLIVAGSSWVDALRAGDPASFTTRLGSSLTRASLPLESFVSFLVLFAPLGIARALEARPWRVALATAASGSALLAYAWSRTDGDWFDPVWLTFVVAAATVGAALGLCLGDRVEVRLASRLGRGEPPPPDTP